MSKLETALNWEKKKSKMQNNVHATSYIKKKTIYMHMLAYTYLYMPKLLFLERSNIRKGTGCWGQRSKEDLTFIVFYTF